VSLFHRILFPHNSLFPESKRDVFCIHAHKMKIAVVSVSQKKRFCLKKKEKQRDACTHTQNTGDEAHVDYTVIIFFFHHFFCPPAKREVHALVFFLVFFCPTKKRSDSVSKEIEKRMHTHMDDMLIFKNRHACLKHTGSHAHIT